MEQMYRSKNCESQRVWGRRRVSRLNQSRLRFDLIGCLYGAVQHAPRARAYCCAAPLVPYSTPAYVAAHKRPKPTASQRTTRTTGKLGRGLGQALTCRGLPACHCCWACHALRVALAIRCPLLCGVNTMPPLNRCCNPCLVGRLCCVKVGYARGCRGLHCGMVYARA